MNARKAPLSLEQKYRACLDRAASLPAGHTEARNRLYETARRYAHEVAELYGEDDSESWPIGCQVDQSWL